MSAGIQRINNISTIVGGIVLRGQIVDGNRVVRGQFVRLLDLVIVNIECRSILIGTWDKLSFGLD